jgi:uncharacterized protein (DUF58 family)
MSSLSRRLFGWREVWSGYWQRWLRRRIPPGPEIVLNSRNLFIFPSPVGFLFLLLVLALLVGAINYENNLLFATSFLLASLFHTAVLHTFTNLAGLRLRAGHVQSVFAGEEAAFEVLLKGGPKGCHDGLVLRWDDSGYQRAAIESGNETTVRLHVPTRRRGWFHPGRLVIQSWYPLGLLRAWSRIDFDTRCLVYPRPLPAPPLAASRGDDGEAEPTAADGSEDFSGFRRYRSGDSLRHVAWKTAAKGGPLMIKQYDAYADRRVWLDWDSLDGVASGEDRLSMLCYWALQLDAEQVEYGLRLPGLELAPAAGAAHRDAVLRALALFDLAEVPR